MINIDIDELTDEQQAGRVWCLFCFCKKVRFLALEIVGNCRPRLNGWIKESKNQSGFVFWARKCNIMQGLFRSARQTRDTC